MGLGSLQSFCAGFAVLACAACAGPAGTGTVLPAKSGADASIATDRLALSTGHVVTEPLDFERGAAHYVGGVAKGVVPATPDRVLAALADVGALAEILPKTKRASLVDARGPARRIELLQGNSVVDATYTVELSPSPNAGEVQFHLDRTRRHDIDDVYGYLKVERFDDRHSVVTVAAAVDIGGGITRMLFGKRVQELILSTPYAMRDYFARLEASGGASVVAQNAR